MKEEGENEEFGNVDIYKAKKKNFKEIAEIYAEGFSEFPYNDPWDFKTALNKIKIFAKYCDIWEIVYENKLVGFIIINPNHWFPGKFCFVENFGIKKEYRGKSIGRVVIKSMMIIYKERGFEYFMGLANKQSRAFKLWESLGIKEDENGKVISKRLE
jgi:ribosomal protein S18 acetylase RimI-like enzyme